MNASFSSLPALGDRIGESLRSADTKGNGLSELLQYKGMAAHEDETCVDVVRSRGIEFVLDHYPVVAHNGCILAGRATCEALGENRQMELSRLQESIVSKYGRLRYGPLNGGLGGHRVVNFENLLQKGVRGVLDDLRRFHRDTPNYGVSEGRDFFRAALISLEALGRFQDRYAATLRASLLPGMGPETAMVEALERVPAQPPSTFHEALQSVWFIQFALTIADDISCTGRPDQYLRPYYERDVAEGRISRDDARVLVEEFFLRSNELFHRWPETIMLAGRTKEGLPVRNDLTDIFLDAVERVGLVNPNVAICCSRDTPEDLLYRGFEILGRGYSHPAFYNDELISDSLVDAGIGKEDSHHYQNVTCVELAPIGNADVQINQANIHMAKVLERLLSGGTEVVQSNQIACAMEGSLSGLSFGEFYGRYKASLEKTIGNALAAAIQSEDARAATGSSPLNSCFTDDCIARGKDFCAGGARYHYCGADVTGFVTTVDSLAAIRYVVYEQALMDLPAFAGVVSSGFADEENLRRRIQEHAPKFGNDDPRADDLAADLYKFVTSQLARYRTGKGGKFYAGIFSGWGQDSKGLHRAKHVATGEATGATPDGRLRGKPLSENIGPSAGSDKSGLTAMLNSATKMDHKQGLGGISLNCRLPGELLRDSRRWPMLAGLLRSYFGQGGIEIQFNAVDSDTLRAAKLAPDDFPTLTVRIAGYSDYFNRLDPAQQDEIIARTEHLEAVEL